MHIISQTTYLVDNLWHYDPIKTIVSFGMQSSFYLSVCALSQLMHDCISQLIKCTIVLIHRSIAKATQNNFILHMLPPFLCFFCVKKRVNVFEIDDTSIRQKMFASHYCRRDWMLWKYTWLWIKRLSNV